MFRLDPRRWILMLVVLPLVGRVAGWGATQLRERDRNSRAADGLDWVAHRLRRDDRKRGRRRR